MIKPEKGTYTLEELEKIINEEHSQMSTRMRIQHDCTYCESMYLHLESNQDMFDSVTIGNHGYKFNCKKGW